jgi:hypothetical protein
MSALHELAAQLKSDNRLCAVDTLKLRREIWPDGTIEPHEADLLFGMNDALSRSPEWLDFFVEALAHYTVHQCEPRGHVSDANADWLIARIAADGQVDTLAELELLIKILEHAESTPEPLRAFALAELERIVLTGIGPTRCGSQLQPGSVTEAEAKLLRRLLYAAGGDRPAAVSRAEAEALFRIKDATLESENHPEWEMLFVQGVGNFLMAYASYEPLDRDEALRLEAFMEDNEARLFGFLGRVGQAAVTARGFRRAEAKRAPIDHEAAERMARAIAADELAWLQARLDADTARDRLEAALLAFLAEESGSRSLPA